jgi:hypothetical protein
VIAPEAVSVFPSFTSIVPLVMFPFPSAVTCPIVVMGATAFV